jgi:hypothetical protein
MNKAVFYEKTPPNFLLQDIEVNSASIHKLIRQVIRESYNEIFTINSIQNMVYEKLIRSPNLTQIHDFFVDNTPPDKNFQSYRKSLTPFIRSNLSLERLDSNNLKAVSSRLISFGNSDWFLCADISDEDLLNELYKEVIIVKDTNFLDLRLVKVSNQEVDSVSWRDLLDCPDSIFDSPTLLLDEIWKENNISISDDNLNPEFFQHYHPTSYKDENKFETRLKNSFDQNQHDHWKYARALLIKTETGNIFGLCKYKMTSQKNMNYWHLSRWTFDDGKFESLEMRRISKIKNQTIKYFYDPAIIYTLMRAFRCHSYTISIDSYSVELPYDQINPSQSLQLWATIARKILFSDYNNDLKAAANNFLSSVYREAGWVVE